MGGLESASYFLRAVCASRRVTARRGDGDGDGDGEGWGGGHDVHRQSRLAKGMGSEGGESGGRERLRDVYEICMYYIICVQYNII